MHRILSQLDVIKGGCLRGMMQYVLYWGFCYITYDIIRGIGYLISIVSMM